MKKKTGLLLALAAGLGISLSAGLASRKAVEAHAAPEGTVIQYSSFFLSGYTRAITGGTEIYIKVALPEYDITTADELTAGVYDDVDVNHWANINFANYFYVNDKPILGWEQLNEDGVRRQGYTVTNMEDPFYSIRFLLLAPSGYQLNSIKLKAGFQLPSNAYLKDSTENPRILYEAETDYEGVNVPGATWEWQTYAYGNPDSLRYVQGHDGSYGYVGVSLPGDDFGGEQLEINTDKTSLNTYSDVMYANGDESNKPFNKYGLFSLGGDYGQGHYAMACRLPKEELTQVKIPEGTHFPSRLSTVLSRINNNNYPCLEYVTTEDRTFNLVGDEYVCFEELEAYKDTLKDELENYADPEGYLPAQQTSLANAIAAGKDAIDAAISEEAANEALANAKAVIDGIPTAEEIAEFEEKKTEAKTELEGYKADVEYREAQAQARAQIIAEGKDAIDAAGSEAEIQSALAEAKAEIDALPTKAEMDEFDAYRNGRKEEARAYKADVEYKTEEANRKAQLLSGALAEMDEAVTRDAIDQILAEYKAAVDLLKTKADYDAEALEATKAEAIEEINRISASIITDEYDGQGLAALNALITKARRDVNEAESEEAINAIIAKLRADIAAVAKKSAPAPGDGSDAGKKGCSGEVMGALLAAGLALCSVAGIAIAKKRKD